MLTKDLVIFRRTGERIKPCFVNVSDQDLLDLASQLLAVYNPEMSQSRIEIDSLTSPLLNSFGKIKVAKGLNKLIQDRCEFSHPGDYNLTELRRELFSKSAQLLKSGTITSFVDYHNRILAECTIEPESIKNSIYGDLPEFERLIKVKQLYPKQLLERYNCSLVQSLLIHSDKITVSFEESEPAKMRRLFKYLKFFRLLAKITRKKSNRSQFPTCIDLEIDGPLSLFENTQKYGLQLACFFPAICGLSKWKLDCEVKIKNKRYRLILDQKVGLVSHYQNFTAYVPEEIKVFHNLFKVKDTGWDIIGDTPFIDIGNQQLLFPDFSFKCQRSDKVIYLELFHRWHSYQLLQRLDYLESHKDSPLIIGVDRALYKKPEIKNRIDSLECFEQNGFLFRDFPTIKSVKKRLDSQSSVIISN